MNEKLKSLRGQPVSLFVHTLSGASISIHGILIGGDLPGQPFGVAFENPVNPSFLGSIGFTANNIAEIELRSNQNIIILK
jgi:hypothetical protein